MTAFDGSATHRLRAPDAEPTPATSVPVRRRRGIPPGAITWLIVPLSIVVGVVAWQWLVTARNIPAFILPPPGRVVTRFATALADGT